MAVAAFAGPIACVTGSQIDLALGTPRLCISVMMVWRGVFGVRMPAIFDFSLRMMSFGIIATVTLNQYGARGG